jgi:hypothetical protein
MLNGNSDWCGPGEPQCGYYLHQYFVAVVQLVPGRLLPSITAIN